MFKKLDELYAQYKSLNDELEPLLEEKKRIKEAIQSELKNSKLDNYSSNEVSASRSTYEREYYPKKEIEKNLTDEQLAKIRKTTKVDRISIRINKE